MSNLTLPNHEILDRARRSCIFPLVSRSDWAHIEPHLFVHGEGCVLVDVQGRKLIDGLSAMSRANSLGYGNKEIAKRLYDQTVDLHYVGTGHFCTEPQIELAEKIVEKSPKGFSRVFFTSGGSEAVESALKLAKQYQQANNKPFAFKTISCWNAYHGSTMGALSVSNWLKVREVPDPRVPGHSFVPNPTSFRNPLGMDPESYAEHCADVLERQIQLEGPDTVAAFIVEPIQQANGVQIFPKNYWKRVRNICNEYNVLIIADEIITAFGRTGHWFVSDPFGVEPDIITCAKALSAGYFPLGAVVAKEDIVQGIDTFRHVHTFSGHAAGCAVALAAISIKERDGLIDRALDNGMYIQEALAASIGDHPLVAHIRGIGHWHAIELSPNKTKQDVFDHQTVARFAKEALNLGVLIGANGTSLEIAPPLIASRDELDEIIQRTSTAIERTANILQL